jgi:hypothetical protein
VGERGWSYEAINNPPDNSSEALNPKP